MITTRSIEESAERYLRNSIRAYFEGEPGCDLNWILGVIGPAREQAREILVTRFGNQAFTDKYRELIEHLSSANS